MLAFPASSATAAVRPLATTAACAAANQSPGVTATTISTGAMSTLTGPIASNFESLRPGYPGVLRLRQCPRRRRRAQDSAHLQHRRHRQPQPGHGALEHTLVDQDHVFAVAGVATAFFTPSYFVQTCTPTFGYNVTGNWNGPPNLFAAGGSIQDYAAGDPAWIYLAKKVEPDPSVGVLAYNIAASNGSCNQAVSAFKQAGIKVSYVDTSISYGGSVIPDAERMKAAGTNFILSCMDVTGNISLARGVQQYGIKAKQLWLNGNDQSTLNQYQSLMQGVYFNIQHVPFDASQKDYPGLAAYISAMKQYQPKWVYDEVAIQGWESAALLVAGLKAAGPQPDPAGCHQRHQQDDGVHGQRSHHPHQLEPRRWRPHLSHHEQHLQRLHPGARRQVRHRSGQEASGLPVLQTGGVDPERFGQPPGLELYARRADRACAWHAGRLSGRARKK